MPLLKNNAFVADDYVSVADDEPLPVGGKFIVSFARLRKDWDEIAGDPAVIGVRIGNSENAAEVLDYLSKVDLVVLSFPSFADGRSYSLARALRLDGYRGELRAEGNVLPDQLQLMRQVGFDSFAVTDRFPLSVWLATSQQMSLAYQRGLYRERETEVWSARHQGSDAREKQSHVG